MQLGPGFLRRCSWTATGTEGVWRRCRAVKMQNSDGKFPQPPPPPNAPVKNHEEANSEGACCHQGEGPILTERASEGKRNTLILLSSLFLAPPINQT